MGNTITVTNVQRNNQHVPHEVLWGFYHCTEPTISNNSPTEDTFKSNVNVSNFSTNAC